VSVLFADLVGFTPFSEDRDAEEVRETLTRYFDIAREVIRRHGGTVEKFIGDAVMAVWGTPTAREDDAERAVRAGLELLDAIRGLGPGITARAGVLTGEAAVTIGATDQGMVAGDLVNTAARLQSVAVPGTVLVGETTFRAASAAIAFEEAGEFELKGKAEPVAAWRALRVVAERGGRGRAQLLEAPFVGRDEELRLLKDLYHATSREQRARLVSVTGPAGIGKSRLAWEFEKYLDGVVETVWWHHGRSPSYGQGATFWALGEMVRARCGLAETADETTTRDAVRAMLERHLSDPSERAWVEPALLVLLGVETDAVATDELFARWRLVFERLAATGTVVMVFEDLHWADEGMLDFIDHLLDWAKAIPLMVVTLARPELLDQRPDWGVARRSFVSVALDPLPEPAMRALLAGLVPNLPEPALRQIVGRAEGIPLYAVETVRMLVADKRLVQQGDVYVVAGDISTLAVPETLTALISARLDALDPEDRSLVMDASVLGQQFSLDGLAAVSGIDGPALEPRLRTLVRRELFTLQADPRSPERGQYGFVQGLIREVAYNTLARRDRKERHLAAARHFERLGSDELAGPLAGHYLAAHANAAEGPEAAALATQARLALRGAADRASALGSYQLAVTLLRQGLTVATEPADRADLLERLGASLTAGAHYADAIAALEEARDIQLQRDDRHAAARVTRLLGECAVNSKQLEDARTVLEDAVTAFADLADDPSVLGIKAQLARAYALLDLNRESIAMADEVLEEAEHADLVGIVADALITKGTALASIGRLVEGAALVDVGGRLAEDRGLVITRLRGLNNLSVVTADSDPAEALRATLEGLALARRVGNEGWTRGFVGNLGYAALRSGEWDLGAREMRAALEDDLEPGDSVLILNNLISIVAFRGEDPASLMAALERACEDLPEQQARALLFESRACIELVAGRWTEAARLQRISAGEGIASGVGSLVSAALLHLWARQPGEATRDLEAIDALHLHLPAIDAQREAIIAGLAALDGRPDEAVSGLATAYRRLVDLGLLDDAGRIAITAGILLGVDRPEVVAIVQDAREFYARVGGTALLAIIDPLLAGIGGEEPARA
jgi:class 3 adenylate cyclase/tetratricopeptide (TPR) repeat protein